MKLAWDAYRLLSPVLGAVAPAARLFASPHERPFWNERMGRFSVAGGCHAWVHAASLGEARAVPPLLRELERESPGARFVLSATTRTGRERLGALGRPVSLAPIDAPQAVRRFLRGIQPERVMLIETELWPHWLLRARRERIPVAVVSARLSERSARHYAALGSGLRDLVAGLDAVLCQGSEDERRWLTLGARPERTRVVGNLKSDGLPEPVADRAAARAALGLDAGRPLLVLGSVRPGEPRLLARALATLPAASRAAWQVVAVPRHERAEAELRAEAQAAGARGIAGAEPPTLDAWRWDARPGVLAGYYAAAEVAFVGGSLCPWGGHNPLEPAAAGAAVLMGPHHASQAEGVQALKRANAIWVAAAGEALEAAFVALLGDDGVRRSRAEAARAAAANERGSASRAVRALKEFGLWPVH